LNAHYAHKSGKRREEKKKPGYVFTSEQSCSCCCPLIPRSFVSFSAFAAFPSRQMSRAASKDVRSGTHVDTISFGAFGQDLLFISISVFHITQLAQIQTFRAESLLFYVETNK